MNCKPGDLALVVSAGKKKQHRIGSIVLVVEPWRGPEEGDWLIEYRGEQFRSLDRNLRPIRPGDISDEEVRDLYAPKVPEAA